ncbi:MAG: DoxX family protein [Maribacter sp.]|nr:DoxX family protein [Maribacter sp.]
MYGKIVKLFLRLGIGVGFLSAVADRLGFWPDTIAAWGNWGSFLDYTAVINPWVPETIIPILGFIATLAEALFGLCLLLGFKTELIAKLSGYLLLIFALAITFSSGIKGAFDYSVFAASGAAFALSLLSDKYLELDLLFSIKK